jgi:hypothetical protein
MPEQCQQVRDTDMPLVCETYVQHEQGRCDHRNVHPFLVVGSNGPLADRMTVEREPAKGPSFIIHFPVREKQPQPLK